MLKKRGVNNVRLSLFNALHRMGCNLSRLHRDATRRVLPRNGRHNSLHTAEPLYIQKAWMRQQKITPPHKLTAYSVSWYPYKLPPCND